MAGDRETETERPRERLGRDLLIVVLTGVALGIAYNALASRGLPWIKEERVLDSVPELSAPSPAAPAEAPGDSGREGTSGAASRQLPDPGAHPAAKGGASREMTPGGKAGSSDGAERSAGTALAAERALPPSVPAGREAAQGPPPERTPQPAAPRDDFGIPDVARPLQLQLPRFKQLFDKGAVLVVDARDPDEYAAGHIRGAISLPYDEVATDTERLAKVDSGGRPIVVYCGGGTCEVSIQLAETLIAAGKHRVLVYLGGYPEWEGAGDPIVRGNQPGGETR